MRQLNLKKSVTAIALTAGLLAATQASATTYHYDIANPPGSDGAGDVTFFSATYNDVSEQLSWSSTIQTENGFLADSFWLVISDGPNPKNHLEEYAIFYGDGNTGNLTSYVYDGQNNAGSWTNPGKFIQSFAGGLTVDTSTTNEVTFSFSIDASNINAYANTADWDGAAFAEKIGIWYHPAVSGFNDPTYNPDGSLASFPVAAQGWYDTSNQTTTVPVPAAAWLLVSGLIGLLGVSRRNV